MSHGASGDYSLHRKHRVDGLFLPISYSDTALHPHVLIRNLNLPSVPDKSANAESVRLHSIEVVSEI